MRMYVAITDRNWYRLLSAEPQLDEVNFWKPSGQGFGALTPGELLLFKLHSPDNFIVGGGFFTRFHKLPVNLAWETFGRMNGVGSLSEMRSRIGHYRGEEITPNANPEIGCIMLAEPFFLPEDKWIFPPPDLHANVVQGKAYDASSEFGRELWLQVEARLREQATGTEAPATIAAIETNGYGKPRLVTPRLGQGLFRVLITETYDKRCAITGERTLPVLDAAHIVPYTTARKHTLDNGLLMRSDLHRLFDGGYITIDPDKRATVISSRIREEFENGREYYKLHGSPLREPSNLFARAAQENLRYHAENIFR